MERKKSVLTGRTGSGRGTQTAETGGGWDSKDQQQVFNDIETVLYDSKGEIIASEHEHDYTGVSLYPSTVSQS